MADQLQQAAPQVSTSTIRTEAEFNFTVPNRAPEVYLSFDGSSPPMEIFVGLAAVGWTIPRVPSPPSGAIDWTPDPHTGNDYTIRAWKVDEFKLIPGEHWSGNDEAEVGRRTIDVLNQHGAKITGIRGGAPEEQPTRPTQSAGSATAPQPAATTSTILVVQPLSASWVWPDDFTATVATSGGASGRKWMWSEGTSLESAMSCTRTVSDVHVYELNPDPRVEPGPNLQTMHFLSPHGPLSDEWTQWLMATLAVPVASCPLHTHAGGGQAVLYVATVKEDVAATAKVAIAAQIEGLIVHSPS